MKINLTSTKVVQNSIHSTNQSLAWENSSRGLEAGEKVKGI